MSTVFCGFYLHFTAYECCAVWIRDHVSGGSGVVVNTETRHQHRQTNTVENSDKVAQREKLGRLGKKKTFSNHLWRTDTNAKGSHLCLRNHLLSLFVCVCVALTVIHSSVFAYAPFVRHEIQAWQLRTCRPFGVNICSSQCAETRWEDL